ncbi:MAG: hypothetical protein WBP29_02970 [Candidatus Zixiibacteriota bacterium]
MAVNPQSLRALAVLEMGEPAKLVAINAFNLTELGLRRIINMENNSDESIAHLSELLNFVVKMADRQLPSLTFGQQRKSYGEV